MPDQINIIIEIPSHNEPVIRCRPVGVLNMTDEAGADTKLIAVPVDMLRHMFRQIPSPEDLPEMLLAQATHFSEHYKDLEEGKSVKIGVWAGAHKAKQQSQASVSRFNAAPDKLIFNSNGPLKPNYENLYCF